jgi:hypothetical protein
MVRIPHLPQLPHAAETVLRRRQYRPGQRDQAGNCLGEPVGTAAGFQLQETKAGLIKK